MSVRVCVRASVCLEGLGGYMDLHMRITPCSSDSTGDIFNRKKIQQPTLHKTTQTFFFFFFLPLLMRRTSCYRNGSNKEKTVKTSRTRLLCSFCLVSFLCAPSKAPCFPVNLRAPESELLYPRSKLSRGSLPPFRASVWTSLSAGTRGLPPRVMSLIS